MAFHSGSSHVHHNFRTVTIPVSFPENFLSSLGIVVPYYAAATHMCPSTVLLTEALATSDVRGFILLWVPAPFLGVPFTLVPRHLYLVG